MENERFKLRFVKGKTISVDLFFKPYMLSSLRSNGMGYNYSEALTWKNICAIFPTSDEKKGRRIFSRFRVLLRTGWLKKVPISGEVHEKYKSSKWVYIFSDRASYYLKHNNNDFLDENGSLFRRRQPKVIYVDKPVVVEKNYSSMERYVGES